MHGYERGAGCAEADMKRSPCEGFDGGQAEWVEGSTRIALSVGGGMPPYQALSGKWLSITHLLTYILVCQTDCLRVKTTE